MKLPYDKSDLIYQLGEKIKEINPNNPNGLIMRSLKFILENMVEKDDK